MFPRKPQQPRNVEPTLCISSPPLPSPFPPPRPRLHVLIQPGGSARSGGRNAAGSRTVGEEGGRHGRTSSAPREGSSTARLATVSRETEQPTRGERRGCLSGVSGHKQQYKERNRRRGKRTEHRRKRSIRSFFLFCHDLRRVVFPVVSRLVRFPLVLLVLALFAVLPTSFGR